MLATSVQTISCCRRAVASTLREHFFCGEKIDPNLRGAKTDRYKLLSIREFNLQRSVLERKSLTFFVGIYETRSIIQAIKENIPDLLLDIYRIDNDEKNRISR